VLLLVLLLLLRVLVMRLFFAVAGALFLLLWC
jgi:hypothetical protein